MQIFFKQLKDLFRYPSAVAGIAVILGMFAVAAYAVITIPYNEAIRLWRGGEEVWYQNPRMAPPIWYNWFTSEELPASFAYNTANQDDFDHITKTFETKPDGSGADGLLVFDFDYTGDVFPQDFVLYMRATYEQKQPFASVMLYTPDGREIRITDFGVGRTQAFRFSQDTRLGRRLRSDYPHQAILNQPDVEPATPLKGTYRLEIDYLTFEPESDLDAEFVMYGLVHGWAGTDHLRRDLMVPLLWGVPIALAFGLVAALGTSVLTMIIAATGVWYSGWVDELIQRITEVNIILPFLSILIMVGTFYSRSLWVILGVTILLSIFTGGIKTYRAIFMQVKESTYIEAARAYGASSPRIVFVYLIPRIIPLLIPGLVSAIPGYVFLEASLAVLGLGDPVLPTWGKIINDAQQNGALYQGLYYWVIEPAVLLMLTGLGFAALGYSLDRVFNPRLRGM